MKATALILGPMLCMAMQCGPAPTRELILFHAGSLSVPLRELAALFEQQNPGVRVKAEASGSRDAARKISDLGRACDVLAVADYKVVAELLYPDHAGYNIVFAGNEMVIALAKEAPPVTASDWPEVLARPGVKVGRSDPERDPCGYRTLMTWQLAERHYNRPGLVSTLSEKDQQYVRPKETDLLAFLDAGEIDCLFIYRSVAEQHKLPMVRLPDEINLRDPARAEAYRAARVRLTGAKPGEFITQYGEPIAYAVTIPRRAANPTDAEKFVALMLSQTGRTIWARNGQSPVEPPLVDRASEVPASLRPMCREAAKP